MNHSILPMIIISLIAGLLSTMNVYVTNLLHIRIHLNDIYMACLMTSWMVTLDGIYHYNHYHNSNQVIIGFAFIALFMYLIRKQVFITDNQYIKGMIPHHSMAILMSKEIKKKSKNQNVISLANNIIESQDKDIILMKQLEKN